MKLQFDPNQSYQHDAIAAVAELFDGQPQGMPEYTIINMGTWDDDGLFTGQSRSELGVGNNLILAPEKLKENARLIQNRNDIEIADPIADLEGWELFDAAANAPRTCPHFSIEMETGTGKTYVYPSLESALHTSILRDAQEPIQPRLSPRPGEGTHEAGSEVGQKLRSDYPGPKKMYKIRRSLHWLPAPYERKLLRCNELHHLPLCKARA